jgi:hypothetical protein
VINRANARKTIFADDGDYAAFEMVLAQAVDRTEMRLLAYCVLPNHWHLKKGTFYFSGLPGWRRAGGPGTAARNGTGISTLRDSLALRCPALGASPIFADVAS